MEMKEEAYKLLDDRLKKELENIVFLELNKDVYLNEKLSIENNIPLPIKSQYLIEGIEKKSIYEAIPFERFIEGMIYTIGCDSNFKYNEIYIKMVKSVNKNMDNYLMHKAIQYEKDEDYISCLIYLRALYKICDKHRDTLYNIALCMKNYFLKQKEKGLEKGSEFFYKLSFLELMKLEEKYPDFFECHYQLGYYYLNEKEYKNTLKEWESAMSLAKNENERKQVLGNILEVKDIIDFEEAKSQITDGDVMKGLRVLIPIVERRNDFSEAKYYTALGYRKLENYKKAEIILNELLSKGEDFPEIYNELGICYFYLNDLEKSLENLKIAVQKQPYEIGFLCNLGLTYLGLGDMENGAKYIEKAYKLNRNDEVCVECYKHLQKIKKEKQ